MIHLKICGMKFPDNIEQVTVALKPDYLGFILYKGSPRYFDADIPTLPSALKKTGVFVNSSLPEVIASVMKHQLQAVQLHGEETPQFCEALRQEFPQQQLEIIKAFPIAETLSNAVLQPYEGKADFFLFDTSGKTRGGTGKKFNWEVLLQYDSPTPFFLSGGIGPEEAESIIELKQQLDSRGLGQLLYGIDLNSRFESEPGRKNIKDLKEFRNKLEQVLQPNNSKN